MRLAVFSILSLFVAVPAALAAERGVNALVEPQLHLAGAAQAGSPRVALTFDACMGKTDFRILSTLIDEKIPATLFVTARWLRHNPEVVAVIRQHPDLFEIENHGRNHVPAVDRQTKIYGIAAAGSPQAVADEVAGGEEAIVAAGLAKPHWFRGATAKYTPSAIADVRKMGYEIAGYSVNGDGGSLFGAAQAARRIAAARDGDVVIAHINQPTHAAGEGVVKGILALKARGVTFVRLADVPETGTN